MHGDLIETTLVKASDPDHRYQPRDGAPAVGEPRAATETDARLLSQMEDWFTEARDLHAPNRQEQMTDADYRDGEQWSMEDALLLAERGQAPLTFPLLKQMVDWVKGTERRTRIDWNVLPRSEEDGDMANLKKELLKYISDVNSAGWERSLAFGDAVDVGVGWIEDCYNRDQYEEPVTCRRQDWKGMWWDPYSRCNLLRDCRYLTRAKYLDLDYGEAMFPHLATELGRVAHDYLDPQHEQLDIENSLPQMFFGSGSNPRAFQASGSFTLTGSTLMSRRTRPRLLALETWYRKPVRAQRLIGDPRFKDQFYDPANLRMKQLVDSEMVSLVDSVTDDIHVAIWTPGLLLAHRKSPYKHRRFPFTPIWGYRRHRDGMPYGLIRLARDAQDEYNKRRSKALHLLSTNQVWFETGAFDKDRRERNLEEARRPDGEVEVAQGALSEKRIEVKTNLELADGHVRLMEEAKANIYEMSGVTRENTGQDSNAISGRAILAKQQQGAVTTAELFDNYRLSIQQSGQKTLANTEQFMSLEKTFRILGPDGAAKFVTINHSPQVNPMTGEVVFENDMTASAADFIVDQMDYRETVRMAMAESMFESIKNLPPEVQLQMLDMAIELTDLPNKAAMARRIRALNGQPEPGQEQDPEYLANKAASDAEKQQRQAELDEQVRADTRYKHAMADKAGADAKVSGVKGKQAAIETAAMLEAAVPLAPTADRIYSGEGDNAPPPTQ